jgi:arginine exporter protein ArgO
MAALIGGVLLVLGTVFALFMGWMAARDERQQEEERRAHPSLIGSH